MKLKIQKPLKSHEIFHFIKEKLGKEYLLHLWGFKHASSIYMWCADPSRAEYIQPNPLEKIRTMLEDLNALGYRDIALAAIRFLARPLGFEVKDLRLEPKKDVLGEFFDLPHALGELSKEVQEALDDGTLTEDEKLMLYERIDELIKNALELKKAIEKETQKGE